MKDKRLRLLKFALFLGFFTFLIFGARAVSAATLYFSPSSGNYTVGNILNASVLVNTQSQAINNSSAVINFPTALLEVISVSKSGSIFSLWVEEPAFSNSAGAISFDGGLPTPGYNGSAGRLLNITFRVKNAGTALLVFSSGAVRANDGYGTDILQTRGQAQFNLVSEEKLAPFAPIFGTPQAPTISSPTHPDSNKWYALKGAEFTWELPSGITGTRLLMGRIPNTIPTVTYIPAISSKELDNLDDGIWYFSVQLRNDEGWGAVSRFRVQIDTEKPERFDITEARRADLTEPKAKFIFDASDKTSGINHYEIQILSNGSSQVWQDNGSHGYETPVLKPGKHTLIAKAVDKAGNTLANSAEFIIEALEAPVITDWPRELQSGELLVVKGTSKYPNTQIVVWLQKEDEDAKSQNAKSDEKGNFVFVADGKLSGGAYKLWAKVVDERGAQSNPSDTVTIAVERPAFLKLGSWVVSLLAVIIPLVALIFILLFIIWYGWHKFTSFRKKLKNLRKEVREAESALHKAFDMLKEDIRDQVKLLEKTRTKRQLTEEEEKVIKQSRKDLDDAEKFVKKEIEDIEKAVK